MKKIRIKVTLVNKKVFYSQALEMESENTQDVVEGIKDTGDMSFFWFIDKDKDVVSFNVNHIATIQVEKVKKYWLF